MSYIFCYGPSQKSELSVLLPDIRLYLQGQESCEGWASTDESWDKLQDHRKYKLFFVNDSRQKDFFINCERWRLKTHFKPCEMTYCSLVEVGKDWRKKLKAEWKKKKDWCGMFHSCETAWCNQLLEVQIVPWPQVQSIQLCCREVWQAIWPDFRLW